MGGKDSDVSVHDLVWVKTRESNERENTKYILTKEKEVLHRQGRKGTTKRTACLG